MGSKQTGKCFRHLLQVHYPFEHPVFAICTSPVINFQDLFYSAALRDFRNLEKMPHKIYVARKKKRGA